MSRNLLVTLLLALGLTAGGWARAQVDAGARRGGRDAGAADAGAADAGSADARAAGAGPADAGDGDGGDALDASAEAEGGAPVATPPEEEAALREAEERERLEAARRDAEEEERAAEEARRRALERAEAARSAAERALARERGRLEGVRAEQAAYRAELARRRKDDDEAARKRGDRAAELLRRAHEAALASADADACYDALVAELQALRRQLAAAIAGAQESPKAPRHDGAQAAEAPPADGGLAAEAARIEELRRSLARAADELEAEARELARRELEDVAAQESEVNAARIALLDRVSKAKRDAVLGFGREGVEQLQREVLHVRLALRYRAVAGTRLLEAELARLKDPFVLGGALTKALLVGALAAVAARLTRRRRAPLERLRASVGRLLRRPALLRPAQALLGALDALFGELAFLAVMLLVPAVIHVDAPRSGLAVLYRVLLWYAVYRLALAAAHRLLAMTALGDAAGEAGPRSRKLLRSVRVVGRYALAVALILGGSAALLGEGYLYHLVARFFWLGAAPIGFVLIRWWRADIADEYLRRRPSGALSGAVRRTRERWYGFFVAVAAFAALSAGLVAYAARRFVLGFEQSRKALAYLFRRRLEQRSEDRGVPAPAAELPEEISKYMSGTPVDGEDFTIERFPDIDRFDEALAQWREGGRIGALLVVGRTGFGKTSWLRAAERRLGGAPVTRVSLRERVSSAPALLGALGGALGAPEEATLSPAALAAWLREGERRVVVIDDLQLCFLRRVGALGGWEALLSLCELAGDQVFWLCAFAHQPYEFLHWGSGGSDVFRAIVRLPGWTEAEIAALLAARMRAAGREARYDDLFVDHVEGVEAEAQLLSTAQDYNRLIWDYAEGSPRVAIDCWRRSLGCDGEGPLRVRLFESPDADLLEGLGEIGRFALAAVVWHERIAAEEAAATLGLKPLVCQDALARLAEAGVLRAEAGVFRVTTTWWPAVLRYLRRKHLIEA